jgi:hypothetical protein
MQTGNRHKKYELSNRSRRCIAETAACFLINYMKKEKVPENFIKSAFFVL